MRAVVLLSGGLDSATVLAMAREQGRECHVLSLRYGQRHAAELDAAARVAAALGAVRHEIVDLDLSRFGGSALTDASIAVPERPGAPGAIPVTYVPARNTIMLSIALGWAEALDAREIHFGANAVDYSGYPDCRPEYVAAFERMANLATKAAPAGAATPAGSGATGSRRREWGIRRGIGSLPRQRNDPPGRTLASATLALAPDREDGRTV